MVREAISVKISLSVYRNLFRMVDAKCLDDNMEALAEEADVIFTATPQGFSRIHGE